MSTSTTIKITLEQKPGIAECRQYTLEVPDTQKQNELMTYSATSYEDHEAEIQHAISEGYATLVSIEDLPVL